MKKLIKNRPGKLLSEAALLLGYFSFSYLLPDEPELLDDPELLLLLPDELPEDAWAELRLGDDDLAVEELTEPRLGDEDLAAGADDLDEGAEPDLL